MENWMPWNSWHTVFVQMLIPEEVWNSAVVESFTYYTPQHSVTPLCNFMRSATFWLSCVHYAIIPVKVDCGYLEGKKFHELICYNSCTLLQHHTFSGPLRTTHSITNVYKSRMHAEVFDLIHLWQRDCKYLNSKIKKCDCGRNDRKHAALGTREWLYLQVVSCSSSFPGILLK